MDSHTPYSADKGICAKVRRRRMAATWNADCRSPVASDHDGACELAGRQLTRKENK